MHSKEETQIQTLLNSRDAIFNEFNANKENLDFETMLVDRKSYVMSDKKSIYVSNDLLMPTLSGLLDDTLNIMSISFSEYDQPNHPGGYRLNWSADFPVSRYYLASAGPLKHWITELDSIDGTVGVSLAMVEGVDDAPMEDQNTFMSIDIWDPSQTPSDTQITNYYKFYKNYPGLQQLSSPLQAFVDAN